MSVEPIYLHFMSELEGRFKKATSLKDRSEYKLYYGPVRPALVLTLGKNPAGTPSGTSSDGCFNLNDGTRASASAGYFENEEHDLLDCEWRENHGLRKLLLPLFSDNQERIRREVVKTNVAFQRSSSSPREQATFEEICAPYLNEIIGVVSPKLILLTGPDISVFASRFGTKCVTVVDPVRDLRVKHTVFAAVKLQLRKTGQEALAVQVAHASQFSWTYKRYGIVDEIQKLVKL